MCTSESMISLLWSRRYCNREWGHTQEIQWSFINCRAEKFNTWVLQWNYRQHSVLLTRVLHWSADIALFSVLLTRDVGMTQSVVFLFHYRWPVSWGDLSLNSESNRQLKLGSIGGGGDRTSPAFCSQAFGSENPVVLREKKKEIPCCFRAKCRGENQKGVLWDPIGTVDLKFQN